MGVFPEPARRADDVSRLVPQTLTGTGHFEDEAVAWLPRAGRETGRRSLRRTGLGRISGTLALGLVAGFGLPQAAFAPAYF
ncbi:MAG: lytic transglycosylase domain-containing protein, partial [Methylobacterium organophilum]|nr:lytic transglycosylase domain-containing protein [Methylobacterium organophilum]